MEMEEKCRKSDKVFLHEINKSKLQYKRTIYILISIVDFM